MGSTWCQCGVGALRRNSKNKPLKKRPRPTDWIPAFAGGIGENSWRVRQQVCSGLEFLGIHLNQAANRAPADGDRVISLPCSRVAVVVVNTNEGLMVARETARVLASS